jgi:molybdopterin/thiamine biosynthesis adenylyltransferase
MMHKGPTNIWTYDEAFDRNIGLLTANQQETLRNSSVAVFGLGGVGGVIAELLTRTGIGHMKIIDNDRFERSNLNRQIFAFEDTLERLKVDVAEESLLRINPSAVIQKYTHVGLDNIDQIIRGCSVAALAIDKIEPCLIISRKARENKVSLVEGWAIPYGNVRVYTDQTASLEEVYGLPSLGRTIEKLSREELQKMDMQLLMSLATIEGIDKFYPPEVVQQIMEKGRIPSFAPMVWLTSVLMALEVIKILLNWGNISYAPRYALYDPFEHRIPKQ